MGEYAFHHLGWEGACSRKLLLGSALWVTVLMILFTALLAATRRAVPQVPHVQDFRLVLLYTQDHDPFSF